MNAISEDLKFYGSYFHGIHDIIEFKSIKQTVLGALKILSGFTGIIPIIFGVGYFLAQNRLKNLESLCGRVTKALTSNVKGEQPTQDELITFLAKVVLDKDGDNNYFRAGYQRLDSTSQKSFFASMSDKRVIVDALARVPKDIRVIAVGLGRNPSVDTIDQTITQLCSFKQLHTVTFDLSQTTHYTDDVRKQIQDNVRIIEFINNFQSGGFSSTVTHQTAASCIISGVANKLIKESALAQVNFCFKQQPGELRPVSIANPARMANIPEEDCKKAFDPLNHLSASPNARDIWLALV